MVVVANGKRVKGCRRRHSALALGDCRSADERELDPSARRARLCPATTYPVITHTRNVSETR